MILLGTKNPHKIEEVRAILRPLGVAVAVAVALPDVEEVGATFRENAALKALAYAEYCGAPALADDSGLVVPALGDEPGVRSARYAGEGAGDAANRALLLRRLSEAGLREPAARFVCALALARPGVLLLEVEGFVEGHLVHAGRGSGGFGYDPVFFHPGSGCTFAELSAERKNACSHRGGALRALARRLPEVADEL
ncbi:MAG: RdgB/HAM1 family non-canonical purine NTP pyrophosphatase [Planctomycetaceae bacterium]